MDVIIVILLLALAAFVIWVLAIYFPRIAEKEEQERERERERERHPTDFLQDINDSEKPYFSKDYEPEVFPNAFKRKL